MPRRPSRKPVEVNIDFKPICYSNFKHALVGDVGPSKKSTSKNHGSEQLFSFDEWPELKIKNEPKENVNCVRSVNSRISKSRENLVQSSSGTPQNTCSVKEEDCKTVEPKHKKPQGKINEAFNHSQPKHGRDVRSFSLVQAKLENKAKASMESQLSGKPLTDKHDRTPSVTADRTSTPKKPSRPRSSQPIVLDVKDFLKMVPSKAPKAPKRLQPPPKHANVLTGNMLDSDNPVRKRGKVREFPKKKMTAFRKAILQSRKLKLEQGPSSTLEDLDLIVKMNNIRISLKKSPVPNSDNVGTKESLLPLDVYSTLDADKELLFGSVDPLSFAKECVHSRKFRSYCTNLVSEELISKVNEFLVTLLGFQDKQYKKDPIRALAKRRYLCGFKEVNKFLKIGDAKLIIIATNLDKNMSIDKIIEQMVSSAKAMSVPVVFVGHSHQLACWLRKKSTISVVGILNYQGAEELFKTILSLLEKESVAYQEKLRQARKLLNLETREDKELLIKSNIINKLRANKDVDAPDFVLPNE